MSPTPRRQGRPKPKQGLLFQMPESPKSNLGRLRSVLARAQIAKNQKRNPNAKPLPTLFDAVEREKKINLKRNKFSDNLFSSESYLVSDGVLSRSLSELFPERKFIPFLEGVIRKLDGIEQGLRVRASSGLDLDDKLAMESAMAAKGIIRNHIEKLVHDRSK
jgi:hypothetical protein